MVKASLKLFFIIRLEVAPLHFLMSTTSSNLEIDFHFKKKCYIGQMIVEDVILMFHLILFNP